MGYEFDQMLCLGFVKSATELNSLAGVNQRQLCCDAALFPH
jgi:hypothetical protein